VNAILEMKGITKRFPGVVALKDVNLAVQPGEIHAICGENGAGKSTLMKVLSGVYPHGTYEGDIRFEGQEQRFESIRDSEDKGIAIIHQELALVPLMSIAENIFLGNELSSSGVIDNEATHRRTVELLKKVGLDASPEELITNLGVGKQQLVEIAKALAKECKLLILDEPTASLNENDSQALLDLLLEFKAQGMTMIMISHKLNEIARVADSVTVLRDGSTVRSMDCVDVPINERIIPPHVAAKWPTATRTASRRSARRCSKSATGRCSTSSTRIASSSRASTSTFGPEKSSVSPG
jgi:putative multiple sugar transport system ATP-binding protein